MTTKTKSATIYDIAAQLDRLCPSQVDNTLSGNGEREAGHVAHEPATIGWSCDGSNVGNAVLLMRENRIPDAVARLAALPDGSLDNGGLKDALGDTVAEWYV